MTKISILGAGKVGTALGLVFARAGCEIGAIASRSGRSAEQARATIGAGRVAAGPEDLDPVEILMIAVSDDALPSVAERLALSAAVGPGAIVFHCSGALASTVLEPLRARGASLASVHPVKSFTDPVGDAATFPGTWCGIEGDPQAVEELTELFASVGAQLFGVTGAQKLVYHAGSVFLCNYLVPLIEAGLACYQRAGVPREAAAQAVAPLMRATIENALQHGGGRALTGPIARGDHRVVADQLHALEAADPQLAELYRILGLRAAGLAEDKGAASDEQIAAIRRLLSK